MYDFEKAMIEHFGAANNVDLQRTEKWFKDRLGVFTDSKIKLLMSCNQSASKMEWGRVEKILSIGEAAKKYIYSKARERQTGKVIETATTLSMRYGTENEGAIKDFFDKNIGGYEIKECGFIKFNDYLGASPDGLAIDTRTGEKLAVEIKANTSFDSEYDREIEAFDQSHMDFWQVQTEMMVLKVEKCLYITAEPSESIFNPKIEAVNYQIVKNSPIHQNAIYHRARLGNSIIEKFLSGMDFYDAIERAQIEFEC